MESRDFLAETAGYVRATVEFDPAQFGRRVATARTWCGMAPKELARRLGRADEAVYRMERGHRVSPPDKLLLRALAHELRVSEEWLLSGAPPAPWEESGAHEQSSAEDLRDEVRSVLAAVQDLGRELSARLDELERRLESGRT